MKARYYTYKEFNEILGLTAYTIAHRIKEFRLINHRFRTDIMLAVTNVNGCRLCSYFHSGMLLKSGATDDELKDILSSSFAKVDAYEYKALLFAQHYAEVKGKYDPEAFIALERHYGKDISQGILAAIRMIMFGNVSGISIGNLWDRLRLRKVEDMSLASDLYKGIIANVFIPTLIVIQLFK